MPEAKNTDPRFLRKGTPEHKVIADKIVADKLEAENKRFKKANEIWRSLQESETTDSEGSTTQTKPET